MKRLSLALIVMVVLGCAATYQVPTTTAKFSSTHYTGSKAKIIQTSQKVLLMEGYQITYADMNTGVVSTAPRDYKVSPNQADCGTTMGIDYLKDKRTHTQVSINVIVDEGTLTVRSNIQGEYKPGESANQDINLTCVSRGSIENEILGKIRMNAGI